MSDCRPTDDELLARFRAGDERAYDLLYARYRPGLLRYARRVLGTTRRDAEDLVQEAFARAHDSLSAADQDLAVSPWMYRIVRNVCLTELRRPRIVTASESLAETAAPEDVHDVAIRREDLREVVRDLIELPQQQRQALLTLVVDGRSHAEAAAASGRSVGANKSLVNRARTNLVKARETRSDAGAGSLQAA